MKYLTLLRQLIGFIIVVISYYIACLATLLGYAGAYLMDNEEFWKAHKKVCQEKFNEIDLEQLKRKINL